MIVVQILALTMPPSLMFQQKFAREADADDYCSYWTRLGSCHVRKERK